MAGLAPAVVEALAPFDFIGTRLPGFMVEGHGQPLPLTAIAVRPLGQPVPTLQNAQLPGIPLVNMAQLQALVAAFGEAGYTVLPNLVSRKISQNGHYSLQMPSLTPVQPGGDFAAQVDVYEGNLSVDQVLGATLYVYRIPPAEGGADEENNCLWLALWSLTGGRPPTTGARKKENGLPWIVDGAKSFKAYLGLAHDARVPRSLLGEVDRLLGPGHRLTVVSEDECFEPFHGAERRVRPVELRLEWTAKDGGHFKVPALVKSEGTLGVHNRMFFRDGTAEKQKRPAVYAAGVLNVWQDGKVVETRMSPDQFAAAKKDYLFLSSKLVSPAGGVEQVFLDFEATAADLDELDWGEGRGNPFRITGSLSSAARVLFVRTSKDSAHDPPADLDPEESRWLQKARLGGLHHSVANAGDEAVRVESCVDLDVNSAYPAAAATQSPLPWACGEFVVLETLPEFLAVGLYRLRPNTALAHRSHPARRLVTSLAGTSGYMTHHDLTAWRLAAAAGLCAAPQLMMDGRPNAIIYGPKARRTRSDAVFGPFMRGLFAKKTRPDGSKNASAKLMMNALIGALEQRDAKEAVSLRGEPLKCSPAELMEIIPSSPSPDAPFTYRYRGERLFKHGGWMRAGVFVKGRARLNTARFILEHAPRAEGVVRVNTDGWLQLGDPAGVLNLVPGLGDVRMERPRGWALVHNMNRIEHENAKH